MFVETTEQGLIDYRIPVRGSIVRGVDSVAVTLTAHLIFGAVMGWFTRFVDRRAEIVAAFAPAA